MRRKQQDHLLTSKDEELFLDAAKQTEQAKHFEELFPKMDESDQKYLRRINQFVDITKIGEVMETQKDLEDFFSIARGRALSAKELTDKNRDLYDRTLYFIANRFKEMRGRFLQSVRKGSQGKVEAMINEGFPVNYQDAATGMTALHMAAGSDARKVVRYLVSTGKCEYLIRDRSGRLASELAYLYGDDPAVARLLGIKERKQADEQGIKLTRRPVLAS